MVGVADLMVPMGLVSTTNSYSKSTDYAMLANPKSPLG
jgi:hypothetical protein